MEQAELVDAFVKATLAPLLSELGVSEGRLGVDQPNYSLIESMQSHLPNLQPTDGDALMQRVRLVKSPDEIAIIQESCAIGDSVTRRAIDATKEGRRENEIAGDAMQTLYYLGGEMAHVITPFVASGEHMSPPHRICTDKIVRNGDVCFIDIGAMWNGYFADIGRTIITGKAERDAEARLHVGLRGSDGRASRRCGRATRTRTRRTPSSRRSRTTGSATTCSACSSGTGSAWERTSRRTSARRCPVRRSSSSGPAWSSPVEPLVWVPDVRGGGGVRIEDMVLITEDEPEVLSRVGYEERLLS